MRETVIRPRGRGAARREGLSESERRVASRRVASRRVGLCVRTLRLDPSDPSDPSGASPPSPQIFGRSRRTSSKLRGPERVTIRAAMSSYNYIVQLFVDG